MAGGSRAARTPTHLEIMNMTDESKSTAPAAAPAKQKKQTASAATPADQQFTRAQLKTMGLDPAPYGFTDKAE
jgi:hypothetical protein